MLFVLALLAVLGLLAVFVAAVEENPRLGILGGLVVVLSIVAVFKAPDPTRHERICARALAGKPASDTLAYAREFDCPLKARSGQ